MPARTDLPVAVKQHLADLEAALSERLAGAADASTRLDEAIGALMRAVDNAAPRPFQAHFFATSPQVIANRLQALRLEAGWTQRELAEAMKAIGFDWRSTTVTEIERVVRIDEDETPSRIRRKVSIDELLAIAALFGVPAVELLLPEPDVHLRLDTKPGAASRDLAADVVRQLLIGRDGTVGRGGPDWATPMHVWSHEPIPRPAPDLWANRNKGGDQ